MVLSQELIQKIIDDLADSPRAVAACTLTCRDWYPIARQYVHAKFTYDGSDACYARLLAYIKRPDLAELVRILIVDPGGENRRLKWFRRDGPVVDLELVRLPNVEELTLLYIQWEKRSTSFREYITTQMPLVKKLHFGGVGTLVTFADFATFTSVVGSFPRVTTLGLQNVTLTQSYYSNYSWLNPETPPPNEVELSHATDATLETVAQISKVDTLVLSLNHKSAAIWELEGYTRKLQIQPLAQNLRLVCNTPLMGNPDRDNEVLPKLLKMFSQTVRHLELDFRKWAYWRKFGC